MADDRNVDVIDLKGKKAGTVVLPGSIIGLQKMLFKSLTNALLKSN